MISQLTFPDSPGYNAAGTSRDAAKSVEPDAKFLRDQCLSLLLVRDLTVDECAKALKVSILSIRPRFSELKAKRMIFDSGVRRENDSGRGAVVWTTDKDRMGF